MLLRIAGLELSRNVATNCWFRVVAECCFGLLVLSCSGMLLRIAGLELSRNVALACWY